MSLASSYSTGAPRPIFFSESDRKGVWSHELDEMSWTTKGKFSFDLGRKERLWRFRKTNNCVKTNGDDGWKRSFRWKADWKLRWEGSRFVILTCLSRFQDKRWTPHRRSTRRPVPRCSQTCRCTVPPITVNIAGRQGGDYRRRARRTPRPRRAMRVATALRTATSLVSNRLIRSSESNSKRFSGAWNPR